MRCGSLEMQKLSDSRQLAAHLEGVAAGGARPGRLSLGLFVGGKRFFASIDGTGAIADTANDSVVLGCLMKVFTATLVAQIASRNQDWRSRAVADYLGIGDSPNLASFRRIRIHHLLNHTHGLDGSPLQSLPRLPDGFIDSRALCHALAAVRPLSAPGELYSYGNAGAWIAAAILESITKRKYGDLLRRQLIEPLGLSSVTDLPVDVCPASGGGLAMSVNDLLTFLQCHLYAADFASMRADPFPLPGWSPSERASCEGWKSYGSGWFGHNAVTHGYSALTRINPAAQTAIVFAGDRIGSFTTFLRLFGRVLPDYANFRLPKALSAEAMIALDIDRYAGRYGTRAVTLEIRRSTNMLVCDVIAPGGHPGESLPASIPLKAADHDIFFPAVGCAADIPFLQFLMPRQTGQYEYLWNGKCVWRRLTVL